MILTTKLNTNQINLVCDSDNYSMIGREAKRTFVDQQKWFTFILINLLKLNLIKTTNKGIYLK